MRYYKQIISIIIIACSAQASWYNINTQKEYSKLPEIYAGTRPYPSATYRHHSDGWREVVPFTVPDGYVKNGNRRIEIVGDEANEVYDVQTEAEAQAEYIESNRDKWEAENAFITAVQKVNATFSAGIDVDDGFQDVLAKLDASTAGTELDRLKAGVTLRTLWDVCAYHGVKWGQATWHTEVE